MSQYRFGAGNTAYVCRLAVFAFLMVAAAPRLAAHVTVGALNPTVDWLQSGVDNPPPQLDAPLVAQTNSPSPEAVQPGQIAPPTAKPGTADVKRAAQQRRIFGVVPDFRSTDNRYESPLNPNQKLELAFRSSTDPFMIAAAGFMAGVSQAKGTPTYGPGVLGYAKETASNFMDNFNGTMIGNGLLPIVFHEDPRYFRKGSGSFGRRLLYAMASQLRCQHDGGGWEPAYGNLLGNTIAAGISNVYYPTADRGLVPTFSRAGVVTLQGMFGAALVEFWPDIHKLFRKRHATS